MPRSYPPLSCVFVSGSNHSKNSSSGTDEKFSPKSSVASRNVLLYLLALFVAMFGRRDEAGLGDCYIGLRRNCPFSGTSVNRARRERAGVLGPGPYYLVGLRSPKTLVVVPVQLPPYGSIGVRPVVDVDVVARGV